jgi:hypothetical protein
VTWLFIHEKLNSNLSCERKILLKFTFGFFFHCAAFCEIHTPHGYGPQSILDTLSKHSHAASSKVCHTFVTVNPAKLKLGYSSGKELTLLFSSSTT